MRVILTIISDHSDEQTSVLVQMLKNLTNEQLEPIMDAMKKAERGSDQNMKSILLEED